MQAEYAVLVTFVALAAAGRVWHVVFMYRQALRRTRTASRERAEKELFDRLERCMQSDRVE